MDISLYLMHSTTYNVSSWMESGGVFVCIVFSSVDAGDVFDSSVNISSSMDETGGVIWSVSYPPRWTQEVYLNGYFIVLDAFDNV